MWLRTKELRSDCSRVFANGTLNILDQLCEVVVGKPSLGGREHLVGQIVAECGLARQKVKERHVVRGAGVDEGVVIVVGVHDQI